MGYRSLRESEEFSASATRVPDYDYLEESFDGLTFAIAQAPEAFPVVPGFKTLRVARTYCVEVRGTWVPALRIFFRIADEAMVDLLELDILFED
ncbi:MAG: hypothetical protein ABI743_07225 [bacterium]